MFLALALAALLTAFYVARQIALVFLGEPRSEAARLAAEPSRWMLAPLAMLAVFAVAAGWAGIPKDFPIIGGLVPDWIGRLLSPATDALSESARLVDARLPFSVPVLGTSISVSLVGLFLGWLTYRRYRIGQKDPLETALGPAHGFLQAGCRFDDLYRIAFVAPIRWIADVVVSDWIDRRLLDGSLHAVGRGAGGLGRALRRWIDLPVINGGADRLAEGTKRTGGELRTLQSGRVQEYLLIGLVAFAACGAALLYRMLTMP